MTTYDPKAYGPIGLAKSKAESARKLADLNRREAASKILAAEKAESEAEYWEEHVKFLETHSWKDNTGG